MFLISSSRFRETVKIDYSGGIEQIKLIHFLPNDGKMSIEDRNIKLMKKLISVNVRYFS